MLTPFRLTALRLERRSHVSRQFVDAVLGGEEGGGEEGGRHGVRTQNPTTHLSHLIKDTGWTGWTGQGVSISLICFRRGRRANVHTKDKGGGWIDAALDDVYLISVPRQWHGGGGARHDNSTY